MIHDVFLLSRAEAELDAIALWLAERSPQGSLKWLDAFAAMKRRLATNPLAFELAPENEYVDMEVRHAMFGTPRGNRYRAIFCIVGNEVRILHIRGPGQPILTSEELRS
jgi:plasmid stabilization system protein ParE